jgi:acyl-CoA synthetase (AMP-forming)/AMP-acid ligase II
MSTENSKNPRYFERRDAGILEQWLIESSMKKYFKSVILSSQYSSIPDLNGSVINVGDWIRKWSLLEPHKRALSFEDRPFSDQELTPRTSPHRASVPFYNGHPFLEIFFALLKMRAILTPLNWRLVRTEIEFILKKRGPGVHSPAFQCFQQRRQ